MSCKTLKIAYKILLKKIDIFLFLQLISWIARLHLLITTVVCVLFFYLYNSKLLTFNIYWTGILPILSMVYVDCKIYHSVRCRNVCTTNIIKRAWSEFWSKLFFPIYMFTMPQLGILIGNYLSVIRSLGYIV